MIKHDQPTIFGEAIIAAVSSADDGPMSFKGNSIEEVRANRLAFLDQSGIDALQATLLQVAFEDETGFVRYKIAEDEQMGEGILEPVSDTVADALVVTRPDHAVFLPLADCAGAVIYDQANQVLMVSHLGRHSIEADGGKKSIEFLEQEFGSDPSELLVWLSPAVGKESYPLHALQGAGLHEAAVKQLVAAGVTPANIEVSHVDTAENPDYFSHSEFLAGNRPTDDRFAVAAMMVE